MLRDRNSLFIISLAAVTGVLAGCSDSHQTVEWYMTHKVERDAKLKWCNDDMARAMDIDCLNAAKAKERAMLSGSSAVDSFKFKAEATKEVGATASTSTPPAPAANSTPKSQDKSAADSFQFKPDPKLFPNAAKDSAGK